MNKINNFIIPSVEETDGNRTKVYDIFSRLQKDRIILLGMPIVDFTAAIVVAQLLFLESEDSKKPIKMYINSPGGDITAGLAIMDTMDLVASPIYTYCVGQCASMAAVLLACGEKGHRQALPSSRVLIHQPWSGGGGGQETDIQVQAKEIGRMRKLLEARIASATGQPIEKVHQDCERDFIMTAEESVTYGIVDKVTTKRS
jgi:ATP-dependent Clp protease protease subunit